MENPSFKDHECDVVAKANSTFIPGQDADDIAQELRIELWRKLPKYDPRRGASVRTFAQLIMRSCLANLAKAAKRDKRYLSIHHLSLESLMESGVEKFHPII